MYQIHRLGVLSVAKIMGAVYGTIALIFVPFFLLVALAGMASGEKAAAFGGLFVIFLAILIPVFYAVAGFIFGALGAWVYNLLACRIGGIEMELVAPGPMVAGMRPPAVSGTL